MERDLDAVMQDIAALDGILAAQRARLAQLEGQLEADMAQSVAVYESLMKGLVEEHAALTGEEEPQREA